MKMIKEVRWNQPIVGWPAHRAEEYSQLTER